MGVFFLEDATGEVTNDVDDEVAGSGGGVEDFDTDGLDGLAKFLSEHDIDAFDHEVDDFLRGVDDAMRIGFSDGETLEETFVNGVEELLTFAPTFNAPGGQFDRYVETVQDLEKFATVEGKNGQDINDFLDLCRYDVAPDEVRVVEDSTEES